MKKTLFLLIFLFVNGEVFAQYSGNLTFDSLFPVINRYNYNYDSYNLTLYNDYAYTSAIRLYKGKYYVAGNFTDLTTNSGTALVVDSATQKIKTSLKWKITGIVYSSVPDGKGGFYIGGNFSKIGDSARNFIAQVDSQGQPTAWNPGSDGIVRQLYQRNDTLFMAGDFSQIDSTLRNGFALYSLSTNKVINHFWNGFEPFARINSFVVQGDTVIYGGLLASGYAPSSVHKFVFSYYNVPENWNLQVVDRNEASLLNLSDDGKTLLYCSAGAINGINNSTGASKYSFSASIGGWIEGVKAVGGKGYAFGNFSGVYDNIGLVSANNFFTFDVNSGSVLIDNLAINGYTDFVDFQNGKLIISGKFTNIAGVARENFAIVDTAQSHAVDPLQLTPTDPITTIAFSKGSIFVSGSFSGIHALRRNGFAIIDSATDAVLPQPDIEANFVGCRNMIIQGDTLYLNAITYNSATCVENSFQSELDIYSLTTGKKLKTLSNVNDITLDGGYLYLCTSYAVRRLNVETLIEDVAWPQPNIYATTGFNVNNIFVKGDSIYVTGDNRYLYPCTTIDNREGFYQIYSKSTGNLINFYDFKSNNPYDGVTFDNALLKDSILYIQGYFDSLNGVTCHDFVAIDINNGNITDWHPSVPLRLTNRLLLFNNKIWFGTAPNISTTEFNFTGLGGIDINSAAYTPSNIKFDSNFYYTGLDVFARSPFVYDYVFSENEMVVGGSFDNANSDQTSSLVRYKSKTALPVTLLNFAGQLKGSEAMLEWQTINEINTAYYAIERSNDGAHFIKIGQTNAVNSEASENYNYIDASPFNTLTGEDIAYYRLEEVDKNGKIAYSKVILLKMDNYVNVYPNPAHNVLYIKGLPSTALKNATICGANGIMFKLPFAENGNAINVSNLVLGLYFLKVNEHVYKFIKL